MKFTYVDFIELGLVVLIVAVAGYQFPSASNVVLYSFGAFFLLRGAVKGFARPFMTPPKTIGFVESVAKRRGENSPITAFLRSDEGRKQVVQIINQAKRNRELR